MMISRFVRMVTLFFIVLSYIPVFVQTAGAVDEFDSKILLERHMEERLKSALTEITGTDKVIVAVNADIESGKKQSSAGQRRGTLTRREDSKDALVLPGVPAKKDIGKSTTQTAELNLPEAPQGSGSVLIRRLVVTILLDKSVSASLLETVRDVAASVVDINPARGDKLEIKQMSISKMNFRWSSFLYPPHLYWLVLIVTGAFFLLAASLFLMNPYIKLSGSGQNVKIDVMKDAAAGKLFQGGEAAVAGEQVPATAGAAAKEQAETALPFSFIKEGHIRDLSFIMSKEPALDVAIIANYLDTELALRLLDSFPEEKQAEIAVCLSGIAEVSHDQIAALEDKLRDRLGYLIGGEDKVANLLGLVSDEVRDKVFSLLESKDSGAAGRLRKQVKDFDAFMGEMSPHAIQVLYRQIDTTLFAQVLKASPEDLQKKVLATLSSGAAERLKQDSCFSRPLTAVRLKKEKQSIMMTIRRMIREGALEVEKS